MDASLAFGRLGLLSPTLKMTGEPTCNWRKAWGLMVSLSTLASFLCLLKYYVFDLMDFAGKDLYNDQQLGFAYAAAEALDFKVFISFDFIYWTSSGECSRAPRGSDCLG